MDRVKSQMSQMRRLAVEHSFVFRVDRRRGFEWGGERFPFGVFDGSHSGLVDVADDEGLADLVARWRD